MITPTIPTDIGEGLTQKAERVPPSQTMRQGRQTPPTSQLKDLTQNRTNIGLCNVSEFSAMCVRPQTKRQ